MTSAARIGIRPVASMRTAAVPIMRRSASGSATFPNAGFDLPAAREKAVELIRECRGREEDPGTPRRPVARFEVQPCEDRDRDEARDRERVRNRAAKLRPGHGGTLRRYHVADPASVARVAGRLRLPGFVNAHSHTFQRALRGSAAGGDFWAWRETMLAAAERQTPALVRAEYELAYREMLAAGYTAVGEFHYLGVAEASRGRGGRRRRGNHDSSSSTSHTRAEVSPASGRPPSPSTSDRSRSCGPPGSPSASHPTRFVRARPTGSRRSAAMRPSTIFRCTSMPTSSRRRSRSASPSTAAARSSSSHAQAA